MSIYWIALSNSFVKEGGKWTSSLASNRYRVMLPSEQLTQFGYQVYVGINAQKIIENPVDIQNSDVVVFGKSNEQQHLKIAQIARESGVKVVVDVCDIHYFFHNDAMRNHYMQLFSYADVVVANSEVMAQYLQQIIDKPIAVIEDPFEGRAQPARFQVNRNELNLVWFGYSRNIQALFNELPAISSLCRDVKLNLKVLTNGNETFVEEVKRFNAAHNGRFVMEYIPWSQEATSQAIAESDIVLIPNKLKDDGLVKSGNRIIESLLAGRFVAANPVPSYVEFGHWAYVGEDLVEGIRWALENPELVVERIQQAQQYIQATYSPPIIARKWEKLFLELTQNQLQKEVKQNSENVVRLNLGCGDKILPDYVNVDVVASRAGMQPDVICDLHDLSVFDDNSADEILSVHVVEHFWRWEVEEVLREWARVLKPGGKMVIECPNLQSACEEFLKNPDVAASGGPEGQRSMWVFYGDPRWQDPLMVHRWGYTPNSLAALLSSVGLTNIRQEPAQYKLREPRDMRLVAEKPL